MTKKPKEDAESRSADRPIRSVLSKTSPLDSPISRVQEEKTRFPSLPIISVWQDDKSDTSSYGQVASSRPIKILQSILRTISKTTSSSQPIKSLRSILRTISKTTSSSRPITSFGRIILRTDFLIGQSYQVDGYWPYFVRTSRFERISHLRAKVGLSRSQ